MKNLNLSSSNMRFLANASEWQKATALENACHSEHNIAEWRISYQNMSFWMERSEMKNLNLSSSNMRFLANASEWQKATALENACHSEHNIAEWRISYQNMSFWMERSEMKNLNLSSTSHSLGMT